MCEGGRGRWVPHQDQHTALVRVNGGNARPAIASPFVTRCPQLIDHRPPPRLDRSGQKLPGDRATSGAQPERQRPRPMAPADRTNREVSRRTAPPMPRMTTPPGGRTANPPAQGTTDLSIADNRPEPVHRQAPLRRRIGDQAGQRGRWRVCGEHNGPDRWRLPWSTTSRTPSMNLTGGGRRSTASSNSAPVMAARTGGNSRPRRLSGGGSKAPGVPESVRPVIRMVRNHPRGEHAVWRWDWD